MTEQIRKAHVAGRFYPADPDILRKQIKSYMKNTETFDFLPSGGVVPHAGIIFSGYTAGRFYGALNKLPDTVILLGPNHTGKGAPVSVAPHRYWETPIGKIELNTDLIEKLVSISEGFIIPDTEAHRFEHSLEVQLPFLQVLSENNNKKIKIIPITLGFNNFSTAEILSEILYETCKTETSEQILFLASSDMSHFISQKEAEILDHKALKPYTDIRPKEFYDTVRENNITMCGVIPALTVLLRSIKDGTSKVKLLHYTTSAEVSGDYSSVVGYAALYIKK